MAEHLQIKSEVFHSFFSLYYNTEPLIINDETTNIIDILTLYTYYKNLPIIIESNNDFQNLKNELSNSSHYFELSDYLKALKDEDKALLIYKNVMILDLKKLNDLTKEQIDKIYNEILVTNLELFKITNDASKLKDYIEAIETAKKNSLNNIQESYGNAINLSLQNNIDNQYRKYKEALITAQNMYKVYQDLLDRQLVNINKEQHIIKELLEIVTRNKLIKLTTFDINGATITIRIYTTPFNVEYTCGDEVANRIIYNNSSLSGVSKETRDIVYDAITDRSKYTLLHNPIRLTIILDNNNIKEWGIMHYHYTNKTRSEWTSSNTEESNTHYFRFACLGGFTADIEEAKATNNIKRFISTILQYIATINLADIAGVHWATCDTKIIREAETNTIYRLYFRDGLLTDITDYYNMNYELEIKNTKAYYEHFANKGEHLYVEHKI